MSWQVDRWAGIEPGSIHHGLGRLADEGLLRRTDLVDAGRAVAGHEVTDAGRAELDVMTVCALEAVDPYDPRRLHDRLRDAPAAPAYRA